MTEDNPDRAGSTGDTRLGTTNRPFDLPPESLDYGFERSFRTERHMSALLYGGLLFLLTSLGAVAGLIWWAIRYVGLPPYRPSEFRSQFQFEEMFSYYLAAFFNPILLILAGFMCAAVGYMMLRAAGAAGRDTLPRQDYTVLRHLITEEKEKGIDLYIKLQSLTGTTGMFTKLGISGLPLATIILTVIFALMGLVSGESKLLDLANLTLGAFLGSYVQHKVLGTAESITTQPPKTT